MWRISADTGGTFTDCYAITPAGEERRVKVLSTGCIRSRVLEIKDAHTLIIADAWSMPANFFAGFQLTLGEWSSIIVLSLSTEHSALILQTSSALPADKECATAELSSSEEAPVLGARLLTGTPLGTEFPALQFRVATTRATNALLERKGSRVALFITQGFGDLPVIGDQRRADLFALKHTPRPQFHEAVCEVRGRLDAQGQVLEPLDEAAICEAAANFVRQGITHAAIALLHSHANVTHEQRVAELLHEAGFTHVSLSSALAPFVKLLPRAQSAIANAYLTGPVQSFLQGVAKPLASSSQPQASSLQVMTSAGGLEQADQIQPKDMLLSGPAGGASGAANAAQRIGHTKIITLDMGGTSTDVARIEGRPGYRFTQNIEGMSLLAPCVAIETVAAGGGSICAWTAQGLVVGPHSAGSNPGPACYGKGGPLAITDVNLLMGRFDPTRAPIPLNVEAARQRLEELRAKVVAETGAKLSAQELLAQLHALAVEHMADAIRRISVSEGYDPQGYALLAFGGAGPQHACAVATKLGMKTILVPKHAGILSAVGLHEAVPEKVFEKQVLLPLEEALPVIQAWLASLDVSAGSITRMAEMRLRGQDTPLQVAFQSTDELARGYGLAYERLFGYAPPAGRVVEVVSVRAIVSSLREDGMTPEGGTPTCSATHESRNEPWLLQDEFSTLVIEPGWSVQEVEGFGYVLKFVSSDTLAAPAATMDLMRHRFHSLVDDMGALLKRTSISTNIRERLDFSCALLDANGRLIASAPHIPVHLGALGVCVRRSLGIAHRAESKGPDSAEHSGPLSLALSSLHLQPGDTIITNHPAFGGSHLPDVTLITPVFDEAKALLGFVANRAHHAEIGGMSPGSMPAHATCLEEEGVVIAPRYLVRSGVALFDDIANVLTTAKYPTRNLADNLADLHAQLAANRMGVERLQELAKENDVRAAMASILDHSARVMRKRLEQVQDCEATETLDDGATIRVSISSNRKLQASGLKLDFTGTSATHPRNLNATTAIVQSAVLYVLRLMLQEDLPLNEGLMQPIKIVLPSGTMLNPDFSGEAACDPAVVGGNVEVSQRLVDTLLKALQLQACSQGTMNNLLFGNERFGYYETIAGGAGAGTGYDGASALHTHMTNTAITDPEILELRYPVRLRQFSIRHGSGGSGQWRGGDGVVREFEFLATLTVSLLTQHRKAGPFGLNGGADGKLGRQTMHHADGSTELLPSSASILVHAGDRLVMETPGGGGCSVFTH